MSASPPPFFTAPLVEPIDRAARARARPALRGIIDRTPIIVGIISLALGVMVPILIVAVFPLTPTVKTIAASVVGAVGVVIVLACLVTLWHASQLRYRVWALAQANGMTYVASEHDPQHPGVVFQQGRKRVANNLVRGRRGRDFEIGTYRYTVGTGRNSVTFHWFYMQIQLNIPLPHIVLDARSNNTVLGSNLPVTFDADQRLSLEGDFDKHFALYCPAGYGRDALYLFSPDVMAVVIDLACGYDIEIIDDRLYLYQFGKESAGTETGWRKMVVMSDKIQRRLDQWERWRDERLEKSALPGAASTLVSTPAGVATPGRRLRGGMNVKLLVIATVIGTILAIVKLFTDFS